MRTINLYGQMMTSYKMNILLHTLQNKHTPKWQLFGVLNLLWVHYYFYFFMRSPALGSRTSFFLSHWLFRQFWILLKRHSYSQIFSYRLDQKPTDQANFSHFKYAFGQTEFPLWEFCRLLRQANNWAKRGLNTPILFIW